MGRKRAIKDRAPRHTQAQVEARRARQTAKRLPHALKILIERVGGAIIWDKRESGKSAPFVAIYVSCKGVELLRTNPHPTQQGALQALNMIVARVAYEIRGVENETL